MKKTLNGICVSMLTVAALVGSTAAPAQTVALYCSWPNDIGFIVDVDYTASRVSIVSNGLPNVRPSPSPASITDHDIRWTATAFPDNPNVSPSNFYINRLTGAFTACGGGPNSLNENFCTQPMKCIPRKAVF